MATELSGELTARLAAGQVEAPGGFNLATILHESARRLPDKVAVRFAGAELTYAEMDAATDACAAGLRARGIRPGDAIALQLPNIPQFLIGYFGILKAGAVAVPLNVLLREREVTYQLADSQARMLMTWAGIAEEAAVGAAAAGVDAIFVVGESAVGRPFEELLVAGAGPVVEPRNSDDTAVIIYTSGTTGAPKGAELSHFQLYMCADISARHVGVFDDDIVIAVLPFFHVFGLSSVLNIAIRFGASLTLIPRFDAEVVLEAIERDRATFFDGVPTMFVALLGHPSFGSYDLSSLRFAVSGGASIPADVLNEFERRTGITILEGYGLSETAATATTNMSAEERKVYSIGKPVWGTELQIWDNDHRRLPPGRENVGELVLRGFNVMKGYWGRPDATAEAFAGGWFHTGDLGYVDEDGFVFIVDRKKDLIIRGGYNVYPREVEEVLYTHHAVLEAAVIGVPEPRLGEEVKAFVVLHEGHQATAEEIMAFTREHLAAYKVPRLVEFRDELPKGPSGKILKTELGP